MSFSSNVKKEISILPISSKRTNVLSELSAILRFSGIYHLGSKQTVEIQTRNPSSARRVFRLIQNAYPDAEIQTNIETFAGKKTHRYGVIIAAGNEKILNELKLDPFSPTKIIPMNFYNTPDKIAAVLRGAFLAAGSINDPKTKNYHLEFFSVNDYLIRQLQTILEDSYPFKITNRRSGLVLYIKRTNLIVDFLEEIGAYKSRFEFENQVEKMVSKNQANRLSNVDNVNIQRAVNAANDQIEQIKVIDKKIGIQSLPENLREIARLRLKNPEATLLELGAIAENSISKSGVKHRLNKIKEIFDEISN